MEPLIALRSFEIHHPPTYLCRIWRPSREIRDLVGTSAKFLDQTLRLYDYDADIRFGDGERYYLPDIPEVFPLEPKRWLNSFFEPDDCGLPLRLSPMIERLWILALTCDLYRSTDLLPRKPDGGPP